MYKFTVSNGKETYTWEEEDKYWEGSNLQIGEWQAPFPNESENSIAYSLTSPRRFSSEDGKLERRNIENLKLKSLLFSKTDFTTWLDTINRRNKNG